MERTGTPTPRRVYIDINRLSRQLLAHKAYKLEVLSGTSCAELPTANAWMIRRGEYLALDLFLCNIEILSSLNRVMLFLPLLYSVYRLCLIMQWIGYVWEHACGYLCPNWNVFICLVRSVWMNPFWMITLIYLSVCAHNEAMSLLRVKCVRASGGLEIWEYANFVWFSISTYIKDIAYL